MEKKQTKRPYGKTGSVSKTSVAVDEIFSMDDLLYVFGYKTTIENLYNKLLTFYARNKQETHYKTYKEWAEKNKVDFRLMPVMKIYGYAGDDLNWLPEKPPSRGDAVFLQLKIRNSYRQSKKPTK